MNEDLEQMRQLHRTLTEHQFAALEVIASADALVDAALAVDDALSRHPAVQQCDACQCRHTALRAIVEDYQRVRSAFGRAVLGE